LKKLLFTLSLILSLVHADEALPPMQAQDSQSKVLINKAQEQYQVIKENVKETAAELIDGFTLKGGATLSHYSIRSQNHSQNSMNMGFNSHLSFRYLPMEFNLSSYVFFGKMRDYSLFGDSSRFQFFANNQTIETSGQIRQVMFSPNFKYLFSKTLGRYWHPYLGAGPSWSLTTLHLKPYVENTGSVRENHRISFLNFGGVIFFGFEEILPFKNAYPVYAELVYSFAQTKRLYLVDASNKAEVKEVSVEDTYFNVLGHTLMFNVGMTLF
jgi:hypothetical protein